MPTRERAKGETARRSSPIENAYSDQWHEDAITSTPGELRRAALTVARNALDLDDAAELFRMLGLAQPCPACQVENPVYDLRGSIELSCTGCGARLVRRATGLLRMPRRDAVE